MFANNFYPGPFAQAYYNQGASAWNGYPMQPQAQMWAVHRRHAGNAQLQHLATMGRHAYMHHGHAFGQPVYIDPNVPVGVTSFVGHEMLTRSLHTRHGGELQTLRFQWQPQGVMTRYPVHTQDVANMLQSALHSPSPRVINLMNPGDMNIHHSYVDRMPEGRSCRVGHLDVWKQTVGHENMGSNGYGGPIIHVRTMLHVRDPSHPLQPWRTVDHHAFQGWLDTTTPPPETFERMWRSLYEPGRVDQGVVHCAGGVGRTPTIMWRLAFQAYLDQANLQGRWVSPAETANFIDQLTTEARAMRGGQVLPAEGQIRLVYESCLRALPYQRVAQR